MKTKKIINLFLISATFILGTSLTGCGSDDDDGTPNSGDSSTQEIETGVFLDSPVSGLHYETDTLSGETNAQGEFHYREGETMTFSLGDTLFGQAMGQSVMTPLDLVPEAKNDPSHPTVSNMVRFMLTLDSDADPNNGIQISSVVKEAAQGRSFHFNMPVSEFESNPEVLTFIGQMTNTSHIVNADTAMTHFQETLNNMGPGNMESRMTGIFVDSPVSGLHYETDTLSGMTNTEGQFHYMEGEDVTFGMGNIMFGQAMGQAVMTPLDLVPGAVDASHPKVTNMVRFMLTLDSDGDPNNGIQIESAMRMAAYGHSFDFDMPISEFESNSEVLDFINQMPHASHMVNTGTAQEHFQGTLDNMGPGMMEEGNMGSGNMGGGNMGDNMGIGN